MAIDASLRQVRREVGDLVSVIQELETMYSRAIAINGDMDLIFQFDNDDEDLGPRRSIAAVRTHINDHRNNLRRQLLSLETLVATLLHISAEESLMWRGHIADLRSRENLHLLSSAGRVQEFKALLRRIISEHLRDCSEGLQKCRTWMTTLGYTDPADQGM